MADNIDITAGSGKTIATDEVGGFHHQRVKVTWGPDGTGNDADTASGKPLPIQIRTSSGTEVTFNANGQAIMANSAPVTLASDQPALKGYYVSFAVSTFGLVQSSAGTSTDFLDFIQVFPATSTCGGITVSDSTTGVFTYTGGTVVSLPDLRPFTINVGAFSRVGPWRISTGGNITCVAVGKFS